MERAQAQRSSYLLPPTQSPHFPPSQSSRSTRHSAFFPATPRRLQSDRSPTPPLSSQKHIQHMSPEQRRGASREVHKRKLMADDPQIRFNFSEPPEESKEEGEMSVESKLNAKGKKKRKRTAQPALEKESKVEGKLKKKRKTAKVKGTEAKISKKAKISKIEVPFRISIIQTRKPELIQEELKGETWEMIVANILLNRTAGKVAIPVFRELIKRWKTPYELARGDIKDLAALLKPIGLNNVRAKHLMDMSKAYVAEPPLHGNYHPSTKPKTDCPPSAISNLPGVGQYAEDSARIFGRFYPGGGAPSRVAEVLQLRQILHPHFTDRYAGEGPSASFAPSSKPTPPSKTAPYPSPTSDPSSSALSSSSSLLPSPTPTQAPIQGSDKCPRVSLPLQQDWYFLPEDWEKEEWRKVMPQDKELIRYLIWRWSIEGVEWNAKEGFVGPLKSPWAKAMAEEDESAEKTIEETAAVVSSQQEADAWMEEEGDVSMAMQEEEGDDSMMDMSYVSGILLGAGEDHAER